MNQQQFLDHIRVLNEKIDLPAPAVKEVMDMAEWVFSSSDRSGQCEKFNQMLFTGDPDLSESLKQYAKAERISSSSFLLFMCEYNSYTTKRLYAARGMDMTVYYESMLDITIWAKTCWRETGCWGMGNYNWITRSLTASLFRLGRLQFQFSRYTGREYNHAGVTVKNGDRVIEIHIPEGGSFSREKRLASYRRAYDFFNQTGNAVFICESWLLYKRHFEFLPENSNTIDFMREFELVECVENDSPADLWRIFGFMDSYDDVEALPKETGLQKAYAAWWAKHHKTGYSYGIFVFDGQNIL